MSSALYTAGKKKSQKSRTFLYKFTKYGRLASGLTGQEILGTCLLDAHIQTNAKSSTPSKVSVSGILILHISMGFVSLKCMSKE